MAVIPKYDSLLGMIREADSTQALGTFTTAFPSTPSVGVYLFAGTNASVPTGGSGVTYYNGDSAYWTGSAWVRIPFQSLANYYTKAENKKYPFKSTATVEAGHVVVNAIRDVQLITTGSVPAYDVSLRIQRDHPSVKCMMRLYRNDTDVQIAGLESFDATPDQINKFTTYTLPAVFGSGVSATIIMRWGELPTNVSYFDKNAYIIDPNCWYIENTKDIQKNARLTALEANDLNFSITRSKYPFANAATLTIDTLLHSAIKDVYIDGVYDDTKNYVLRLNRNVTGIGWMVMLYSVTSGGVATAICQYVQATRPNNETDYVIYDIPTYLASGFTAKVLIKWDAIVENVNYYDASKYKLNAEVFNYNNSYIKILEDNVALALNYEAKNTDNKVSSINAIKALPLIQKPIFDLNQIIQYGQSLAGASESYVGLSATNIRSNKRLGHTFHVRDLSSLPTLADMTSLSVGGEREPTGLGASNAFKYLFDQFYNELTLSKVALLTTAGEGGRSIEQLTKGFDGDKSDIYTEQITNKILAWTPEVASIANKTIGCIAINWMQGEANSAGGVSLGGIDPATHDKDEYKVLLLAMKNTLQADIMAAYEQEFKPLFFMYVPGGIHTVGFDVPIQMAFLEFEQENDDVIIYGPTYPQPKYGSHLSSNGYRILGEQMAKSMYYAFCENRKHRPLQPRKITRSGKNLIIDFIVPKPPLVYNNWTVPTVENKGFQVKLDSSLQTITSVTVYETYVIIELPSIVAGEVEVNYAGYKIYGVTPDKGWGNICDSDDFKSLYSHEDDDDGTHHVIYQPTLENGDPVLGTKYNLANWCLPFYYKLLSTEDELIITV